MHLTFSISMMWEMAHCSRPRHFSWLTYSIYLHLNHIHSFQGFPFQVKQERSACGDYFGHASPILVPKSEFDCKTSSSYQRPSQPVKIASPHVKRKALSLLPSNHSANKMLPPGICENQPRKLLKPTGIKNSFLADLENSKRDCVWMAAILLNSKSEPCLTKLFIWF